MDLHGIARGVVSAVNPEVAGTVRISDGYTQTEDGKQVPKYLGAQAVNLQVQPLTTGQLRHLDALNIQGVKRRIYVHGRLDGVVRPLLKGGDLIFISQGINQGMWLVVENLEQWADWCCVAATLQNQKGITP